MVSSVIWFDGSHFSSAETATAPLSRTSPYRNISDQTTILHMILYNP